ncbi:MAG: tRNA (guanosine(37)-N1)-methyltransferase TrmD [Rhodospirillaceae bacterium]
MEAAKSGLGAGLGAKLGAGLRVEVLTLFPEMFPGPLGQSLSGKALADGLWSLGVTDIRDYATDRHGTVDDSPFGGGAGMVMRPDVVDAALEGVLGPKDGTGQDAVGAAPDSVEAAPDSVKAVPKGRLIYLTPRGRVLDRDLAWDLSREPQITLLCGRYEGVDQRVLDHWQAEEVSIGDYVLSGGELAAMVVLDSVIRLLPGVVGKTVSLTEESFETGLLEHPHYTRPAQWRDHPVPDVLLSGHHGKVAAWRSARSEEITRLRRPDLWDRHVAQRDGMEKELNR